MLVDGAQALPAIERAIRGARRHVHIAGWSITPHFPLTRDEPPVVLRELLAERGRARRRPRADVGRRAAAHFAPDRATVRDARDELTRGTRVRVALRRALARRCTATTRSS